MSGWILRAGLITLITLATAQRLTPSASAEEPASKQLVITYKPPKTGAPDLRVGSGTRGKGDSDLVLTVITPPHAGETIKAQPTLYWYQSRSVKVSLELYVTDIKSMKTVIEKKVPGAGAAGFHSFDLTESGAKLEPGKQYEWSVTAPGSDPSDETVTTGAIIRVDPSKELTQNLASAEGPGKAVILASNGIWYDAFAEISELIEKQPDNKSFQAMRDELLRQAKLDGLIK